MFEKIEDMKRQYTDKYVVVDSSRPELARFREVVGRVKTVNMSGRALVEFDEYHLNIGWYDIDTEFLKVVDKPPPKASKAEVKKAPAKAPEEAKSPAKAAPAAAPKAGKPSVAEILAAARAGKATAPAPAVPKASAEAATAPAKPQAAPPAEPAKLDRSKMSVADMLAAARAGGAGGAAAAPKAPASAPAVKAKPDAAPAQEVPVADESIAEATPAKEAGAPAGKIRRVDKSGMSIDDILAYCRQHDSK
jgi:hypothetical protein